MASDNIGTKALGACVYIMAGALVAAAIGTRHTPKKRLFVVAFWPVVALVMTLALTALWLARILWAALQGVIDAVEEEIFGR